VIATEVDAATVQAAETREQDDLRLILFTMERNPSARKPTAIAEAAGLLSHVGTEARAQKENVRGRVRTRLKSLAASKLVEPNPVEQGAWRLTQKGEAEVRRMTQGTADA
jgi:hypothetical protein